MSALTVVTTKPKYMWCEVTLLAEQCYDGPDWPEPWRGAASLRYGIVSDNKLRGHFVRVMYHGSTVSEAAQSPDLKTDAIACLDRLEKQKLSARRQSPLQFKSYRL